MTDTSIIVPDSTLDVAPTATLDAPDAPLPSVILSRIIRQEEASDKVLLAAAASAGIMNDLVPDAAAVRKMIRVYRTGRKVGGKNPLTLAGAATGLGKLPGGPAWVAERSANRDTLDTLGKGTRCGLATLSDAKAAYFGEYSTAAEARKRCRIGSGLAKVK